MLLLLITKPGIYHDPSNRAAGAYQLSQISEFSDVFSSPVSVANTFPHASMYLYILVTRLDFPEIV